MRKNSVYVCFITLVSFVMEVAATTGDGSLIELLIASLSGIIVRIKNLAVLLMSDIANGALSRMGAVIIAGVARFQDWCGLSTTDLRETLENGEDDIERLLMVPAVASWGLIMCFIIVITLTYWLSSGERTGPTSSLARRRVLSIGLLGSTVFVCALFLRSQERISRVRLMQRAGAEALSRYVQGSNAHRYRLGEAPSMELSNGGDGSTELFESAHWLNSMVAGAWSIEDGGVGSYMSENIANSLRAELARVPREMGALELKRFHLGSTPPTVFGLRTGKVEAEEAADGTMLPEQLWADLDFIYFAGDMAIELSLQPPNLNVALPDKAVQVSSLYLSGGLRLTMDTIPTYPFVGNASIAFLTLPALDMGVSTFGGVDLSSVPVLQGWINSTLFYVIDQMTFPHVIEFDLGAIVCPNCVDGDVNNVALSVPARVLDAVLGLTLRAKDVVGTTLKRVLHHRKRAMTGKDWTKGKPAT